MATAASEWMRADIGHTMTYTARARGPRRAHGCKNWQNWRNWRKPAPLVRNWRPRAPSRSSVGLPPRTAGPRAETEKPQKQPKTRLLCTPGPPLTQGYTSRRQPIRAMGNWRSFQERVIVRRHAGMEGPAAARQARLLPKLPASERAQARRAPAGRLLAMRRRVAIMDSLSTRGPLKEHPYGPRQIPRIPRR